jgi:hypothetical protein
LMCASHRAPYVWLFRCSTFSNSSSGTGRALHLRSEALGYESCEIWVIWEKTSKTHSSKLKWCGCFSKCILISRLLSLKLLVRFRVYFQTQQSINLSEPLTAHFNSKQPQYNNQRRQAHFSNEPWVIWTMVLFVLHVFYCMEKSSLVISFGFH